MSFEMDDVEFTCACITRIVDDFNGTWNQIAATSQDAERQHMKAGTVAPKRGSREVVGSYYRGHAANERGKAKQRCRHYFDRMMKKAEAEVCAVAPADEIATVEAALKTCRTEDDFWRLYDHHHTCGALAKLIRSEAAKKRVVLPETLSEQILANGEEAWQRFEYNLNRSDGAHPTTAEAFYHDLTQ